MSCREEMTGFRSGYDVRFSFEVHEGSTTVQRLIQLLCTRLQNKYL